MSERQAFAVRRFPGRLKFRAAGFLHVADADRVKTALERRRARPLLQAMRPAIIHDEASVNLDVGSVVGERCKLVFARCGQINRPAPFHAEIFADFGEWDAHSGKINRALNRAHARRSRPFAVRIMRRDQPFLHGSIGRERNGQRGGRRKQPSGMRDALPAREGNTPERPHAEPIMEKTS